MFTNQELKKLFVEAITDSQKVTVAQLYYIKSIHEMLSAQYGQTEVDEDMATKAKALYEPKPVGPTKMGSVVKKEVKNVMDKKATPRKSK